MTDAAFNGAGKSVGLELWRIEKLTPVKQPNVNGKFHVGDSYILLSTTASKSGALSWNIHFWLGAETSQDESGVAAYKTIELDDSLGGGPVQYREVQGYESDLFLSYFKKTGGVEYLPGGVESGFRTVERDVWPTRLLHIKGKRTVRVDEVPLQLSSLNSGDVFILDKGLTIFLFNGPTANRFEKAKGVEVAQHINSDERGGRANIVLVHEDPQNSEFWEPFGGYHDPNTLAEGPPDANVEAKLSHKLFHISDASGSLQFNEVAPSIGGSKFSKNQLLSDDVFLVQSVSGKIFLWIGRKANLNEKKEATARAVQYIAQNNLPPSTTIERVSEGCETAKFKSEFAVWDAPTSFANGGAKISSVASSTDATAADVDISALLARKKVEDTPVDDGSGSLQIWAIKDFKKEPVQESQYGQFFGGDSYILLYTYKKGNSEEHIIYFWLGNDSTADEKGAAALLTVELDDSMGGKPVQVRVTQGKEPAHFRQLFKGKMVVYKGGNASGFEGTGASAEQSDTALFHVRGTNALNTVSLEVSTSAANLNSEDCFVLVTPDTVFTWSGNGANDAEKAVAATTATLLADTYKGSGGRTVVDITEGSESGAFWEAIGGQEEYPSMAPGEAPPRDPRLFSASTATGTFRIEEVDAFDQSDLNDEDVFLLDTYTSLFVWVGTQSTEQEKKEATAFAQRYIAEADDGRDVDMPIVRVTAAEEPAMFSCHFHGWDGEYFSKRIFKDPYQAKLDALAAEKAKNPPQQSAPKVVLKKTETPVKSAAVPAPAPVQPAPVAPPAAPVASSYAAPVAGSYTLEQLQAGTPSGVDPAHKEDYLDDKTFAATFGMNRATFSGLAKWKRDGAKKKASLF